MALKYGRPIEARLAPVEAKARAQLDLTNRPRRNRKADWARRLVREHVLTADDLIWPLFLVDGTKTRVPVASMPGVERLSVDEAVRDAARAAELDPCLALFPYTEPALRDQDGSEALNPGQPGLPRHSCDQERGAPARRALRRRARSLYQPRP